MSRVLNVLYCWIVPVRMPARRILSLARHMTCWARWMMCLARRVRSYPTIISAMAFCPPARIVPVGGEQSGAYR